MHICSKFYALTFYLLIYALIFLPAEIEGCGTPKSKDKLAQAGQNCGSIFHFVKNTHIIDSFFSLGKYQYFLDNCDQKTDRKGNI